MKRFYRDVAVTPAQSGWQVTLDGRPVKTQGGNAQIVPTRALAEMLANEWAEQGDTIDPKGFRYRDLADYAIDIVRPDREAAIAALLRYAETDTLCYHADPDEPLWKRQQEVWEPLLKACETREGITLQRVSGIIHRAQSAEAMQKLSDRLGRFDDFSLATLTTIASLGASLVVGLAAFEGDGAGDVLWDAVNLEEDWQAELWGRDEEAEARRQSRKGDFLGAIGVVTALCAD